MTTLWHGCSLHLYLLFFVLLVVDLYSTVCAGCAPLESVVARGVFMILLVCCLDDGLLVVVPGVLGRVCSMECATAS